MTIIHLRSGRLSFKTRLLIGLAIFLTFALLTLLALAVISIVLVIVPVLLVAGMVYALLPGRRRAGPPHAAPPADVLEGRYRVLDRKDRD